MQALIRRRKDAVEIPIDAESRSPPACWRRPAVWCSPRPQRRNLIALDATTRKAAVALGAGARLHRPHELFSGWTAIALPSHPRSLYSFTLPANSSAARPQ